jgi:hypothetical protein
MVNRLILCSFFSVFPCRVHRFVLKWFLTRGLSFLAFKLFFCLGAAPRPIRFAFFRSPSLLAHLPMYPIGQGMSSFLGKFFSTLIFRSLGLAFGDTGGGQGDRSPLVGGFIFGSPRFRGCRFVGLGRGSLRWLGLLLGLRRPFDVV